MNRLARESSPYLRQHMHNPVDWYPWGEEAFAAARALDRPILLSIGYSACHWCHVMERESFEDAAIAARMNEGFVNVKVDREERPDVDNVYQTAVQLLRRSGGWPLTAFLTPDGRPFFVGTYFPPEPRHGLPGFPELLGQVRQAWEAQRGEVDRSAAALTEALGAARATGGRAEAGGAEVVADGAMFLLSKMDPELGGFGTAPKFPSPTNLWTVWRHARRAGDAEARDAVLLTLRRMADGGLYDHVGGGFHRYSTDRAWHVPHFEKMLYDNALLVPLYLDAWRECAAGRGPREAAAGFLAVARDTLAYLLRDMRAPEGLFYAATDADSEGVEGRYFVWTPAQVRAALAGEADADALAAAVAAAWDVSDAGNWEGVSILRRVRSAAEVAAGLGIAEAELDARLQRARPLLLAARGERVPPLRDDKRLCAWNALVALAFLDAWRATGEGTLLDVARETVDALVAALVHDGRLAHSTCDGDVKGPGLLDDHAALGLAALQLHEVGHDPRHLDVALGLAVLLDGWFRDGEGGWFQTPADGEALIVRPRDAHDSAVPSGAGLAATFLQRLGAVTGEDRWTALAEDTLRAHAGQLEGNPYGAGSLLAVLDAAVGGWEEVVLAGEGPERAAMERVAGEVPGLDRLVLDLAALPADHPAAGGRAAEAATAWVCRGRTCSLPIRSAEALRALLAT